MIYAGVECAAMYGFLIAESSQEAFHAILEVNRSLLLQFNRPDEFKVPYLRDWIPTP